MYLKKIVELACIGLLLGFVSSCSSVNGSVGKFFNLDTDLKLTFKVESDINPDDQKTPAPLFIRLYELKSTKSFAKAGFLELFERDKEILGGDMLAKQRLKRIKPGEDYEVSFVLDENTKYVGLFAEFLEYKNSNFRVIIPIVPHNVIASSATIRISGDTLNLVKE
ncbi:MAG: type VI secretion system lipoprotein TssJ [Gammaproteobacteria bacterium]|nr:type VI secretion system lipoprotein TssJ [Gammaproteobacteria bacterium]